MELTHPSETFRCVIVDVEDDEIHVESVDSSGEEADAWLPLTAIDPWRRWAGEEFTIRVYVPVHDQEDVLHEYIWHTPARRFPLNRRTLREYVYPIILSIALGMLGGDTIGSGITVRTGLYLAAIAACWTGIYLSRRRPRPGTKPGHVFITSDD